jgi:predicted phosphodiesterase
MRIALISDIHEDIINLQLALDKIERMQCDEIVCLGDISGYSATHHNYLNSRNARECLRLVRKQCSIVIPGNHDLHAAFRTPKFSGFDYAPNWYDMDYWQRNELSKGQVWLYEHEEVDPLYTHDDTSFLFDLPEMSMNQYGGMSILFSHYLYPNLTGSEQVFYHDPQEFNGHKEFMKRLGAQIGFAGHRHYGGVMVVSGKTLITKSFGKVLGVKEGDIIHVPAITRAAVNSGFLVFDDQLLTVQGIRI